MKQSGKSLKSGQSWPKSQEISLVHVSSCLFHDLDPDLYTQSQDVERCWKICDFVWIVPCLHKTQLYPNMNYYDMLCISLYLTISHCIFLTCRSYTPNKHPNSRISGIPEPQPVFSLSVHDEPGWLIWINWNQNWILTGAERREWMGHDGLLGLGLWFIDSVDHSFENSLRIARTHQ